MSWKGFQKGIVRTPQTSRQKMNKGPVSKDLVFEDAERRFFAIEAEAKKSQLESKKYSDAIKKILHHQIEYSKVIEQLHQPISGVLSDPNAPTSEQTNPEAIAACQQYRQIMEESQASLQPDLDMVETQIYQPCEELLALVESVKKILTKRSHKQLDSDRHASSLRKVQDRNDRNAKQEEKMFKVENEYEIALEEFNYFNDLSKTELVQSFKLEGEFIKPLFESFYFMQLNVFYTMQTHLEQMRIPYLDLEGGIVDKFNAKRGDVLARTEGIPLIHFAQKPERTSSFRQKFTPGSHPSQPTSPQANAEPRFGSGKRSGNFEEPLDPQTPQTNQQPPRSGPRRFVGTSAEEFENSEPLPAYSEQAAPAKPSRSRVESRQSPSAADDDELRPKLPNRRPVPGAVPEEYCTALYDFVAQSPGDSNLRAGDRISVIDRSDANGWWTGKLGKEQGIFPGTYVQLI